MNIPDELPKFVPVRNERPEPAESSSALLRRPKVLVVDDTPANLLAFQLVLDDPGWQVVLANSGQEALVKALAEDFAVILLDIRMPGMGGLETAMHLRQRRRTRHTPIIFMSAHDATPQTVAKGYLAGAIDYLFSPVDEEALKRKVAAFSELYQDSEDRERRNQELTRENESLKKQVGELTAALSRLQPQGNSR